MKIEWIALGMASLVTACGNGQGSPSSSSSSHWLMCDEFADCAAAEQAVACTDGYCVDEHGDRIPVPARTSDSDASSDGAIDAGSAEDSSVPVDGETPPPAPEDAGTPGLAWHTFYGSDEHEEAYAIAVGADDSIYVAGETDKSWSGPNGESPRAPFNLWTEMFVLKLDAQGAYQWHAFFGSDVSDYTRDLAVGADGNLYLTGSSGASWSGPQGELPRHAHAGGGADIVVLSLGPDGGYRWHTFLGGTAEGEDYGGSEYAAAIAVDRDNNVYVGGEAQYNFDGPQGTPPLRAATSTPLPFPTEAVVAKYTSEGDYVWHTFLGGMGEEFCSGLDVDAQGQVYLTGGSDTAWVGVAAPIQPRLSTAEGELDVFVANLSPTGALGWHTFLGASAGHDFGHALRVGPDGALYVGASSGNLWQGPGGEPPVYCGFQETLPNLQTTCPTNGGAMQFELTLIKLANTGAYAWHSFFTNSPFYSFDVSFANGRVVAVGSTERAFGGPAGELPVLPFAVPRPELGDSDVTSGLVMGLELDGTYAWHTFSGPTDSVWLRAVAGDSQGRVVASGSSLFGNWSFNGQTPLHTAPAPEVAGHDAVVMSLRAP